MAVYPVPAPRPAFAPSPALLRTVVRRGAAPKPGAVRTRAARPRSARRHRGTVRATFAITPLAAVFAVAVVAGAFVVGLVRAVTVLPSIDGLGVPRRRHASRARVGRTGLRVGLGLAVIAAVFSVGFIYVDRSVQISARNYDLDTLLAEHDDLLRQQRTLENDLARLGSESAVAHDALDQGLIRLGPPMLVPAR